MGIAWSQSDELSADTASKRAFSFLYQWFLRQVTSNFLFMQYSAELLLKLWSSASNFKVLIEFFNSSHRANFS